MANDLHFIAAQIPPSSEQHVPNGAQHSMEAPSLMHTIYNEIGAKFKRHEKEDKCFITYEDIRTIWPVSEASRQRIQTMLEIKESSADLLDTIQNRMILILSILIRIWAKETLLRFTTAFFPGNSNQPHLTDDDLPLALHKIHFIKNPARRKQFHNVQYQFLPTVIMLSEKHKPQVVDPLIRLPFESWEDDIGSGGYGDVARVGIASRCLREANGSDNREVRYVACKSFKQKEAYENETQNLQVLKESISGRHKLVLLHLATIHHGPERYLLLPYAELGDLYQFLHCGMGVERKRKYNFAEQFRGIEDSDLAEPLVRQASGIASAIDWLHSGITVGETLGKIYCAHMDLKPDNILIRASETSIVGEWVLSDFGISVVKTKGVDADVGSIQDWLTQATMNTRPRRIGGTYQAPEVELSQELNLTDTQHGIGKKSDIWSYGCILSEVLAFALNKATSVSEFQRERKGVRGDDKFYEENNDRINVPGTKTFRLRSSVRMWLERQRDVSKSPPTWVSCWVRAIYDILVVDARTRPNSAELMRLLTKLVKHVKNSSAGRIIPCEFCQNRDSTSLGGNGRRSPIIPEGLNINYNPRHAGGHLLGDFNTSYPILSGEASSASASPMSETFHRRFNSLPTKSPQPSADSLLAHGIVMSPAGQRTSKKPVVVHTRESTHAAHAVAIAYFEDQTFVASLEKQSIVLQTLDVDNCSVLKALDGTTIHLETDRYRSLALAGPYLAAWHFSSSKLLYLCKVIEGTIQFQRHFQGKLGLCTHVALSQNGLIALLCRTEIKVIDIEINAVIIELGEGVLKPGQTFLNVAFNESGDLLYAWAFGAVESPGISESLESLYVWRVRGRSITHQHEFETHYPSEDRGRNEFTAVLLPYDSYPGCIISAGEGKFFPAQVQRLLLDQSQKSPRYEQELPTVKVARVFQHHSLVTVTRCGPLGWGKRCLKEHQITYEDGGIQLLDKIGKKISLIESEAKQTSELAVIQSGLDLVVVICNINGTVEFIKFEMRR